MRKTFWTVIKIMVIVIIVIWMIFFVVDHSRAQNYKRPLICLKEENIQISDDVTFYRCTSFGYKYFEYTDHQKASKGFGAIFIKYDIEKEIGV